jgi:hypothetical protein
MGMSLMTIIARDKELTAFKHFVLDNPNKTIEQTIDDFGFQHINAEKMRENLIAVGRDTRRYPHRIPKQ